MKKIWIVTVLLGCLILVSGGIFAYFKYVYIPGSLPWMPVSKDKGFDSTITEIVSDVIEEGESITLDNPNISLKRLGEFSHHYSKRQAWNTSETHFLTKESHILSVDTSFTLTVGSLTSETVWSNTDPDILFGIQEHDGASNRFVSFNIKTRKITEIEKFEIYEKMTIGQWEGTITNDDQFIVLVGEKDDQKTLISYNVAEKEIVGQIQASENFNWAGFSQLGNWIVVENNKYPDPDPKLIRYKPDFTEETVLLEKPNHGDFCIDAYGEEVYAMTGRNFYWVNLSTKAISKHMLPSTLYGHTSCRATDRPGWAYVSFEEVGGRIGAIPLIPNFDRWEPWSFHYSLSEDYSTQPRASVSRSGKSIVFSSDWSGEIPATSFELRFTSDETAPPIAW